jgi:GNAT superfamily N-acetyltransferase
MHPELNSICTRLELAQASQNLACARAGGGEILTLPGALGVFLGQGHMFNQGLALGLGASLPGGDLERLETFLGRGGATVVVELTPGADPELPALLTSRGYRIQQFQQVWSRDLLGPLPLVVGEIRPITAIEAELSAKVVQAGFLETDDIDAQDCGPAIAMDRGEGTIVFLAFVDGRPAAGGSLGIHGDVAALSGTSVLPRFRGQGLQRALLFARLTYARNLGCRLACSASLPGTVSQANLERTGFRTAYPKLELVRDPVV